MKGIIIKVDGIEWVNEEKEIKATGVECWYDRHRRNWVIYPVDAEGNQLQEARYGFGKAEALKIKKEIEQDWSIK